MKQLSSLNLRDKIKFGTIFGKPIVWIVADKNHAEYPANSLTFVSEKILKAISYDVSEEASGTFSLGRSRYLLSNVRQWLNSSAGAGQWYTAQHATDKPPTAAYTYEGKNAYANEAAFLAGFTEKERNAILPTTITAMSSRFEGLSTDRMTDKVFLLSFMELGGTAEEGMDQSGSPLRLFTGNMNNEASCTPEAKSNYQATNMASGPSNAYWTRSAILNPSSNGARVALVGSTGHVGGLSDSAYNPRFGLRPAINLSASMYVSDNPDSDGCYTIVYNSPPTAPTYAAYPNTLHGGQSFAITWSGASDPDNNLSGYRLQRSVNGGTWSQVYAGAAASYTDNLAFGTANTVAYRVQVYDSGGLSSGWKTGSTANVINNRAPGMPGAITLPGTINGGQKFTVSWGAATDADGNLSGYYCERSTNGGSSWTRIYQGSATSASDTLAFGSAASVLYRVQAYDAHSAVSGWRTSASKTVVNNRAPNAPGTITVPVSVVGGKTLTVTWAAASDPDGNLSGYKLERSAAGGAWTQVYAGNALSFNDAITKGWATVAYRVRAYDAYNAHSGYTTSQTRTVDNNTAPTITCSVSGNLGTKTDGFSVTYTVADAEKDKVTVVEAMDGVQKRSYTAALGATNTFAVTGDYFMKLLNGPHTMKITAADPGGKSTSVTLTFTKAVHACSVTLAQPMETDALVKRAVMNVVRSIPADAQFLVEVTNNAFDASPAWEDATQFVKAGINYVFNNKQAAAGKSGYNFRITASRANGGQGGYISSIGGALE